MEKLKNGFKVTVGSGERNLTKAEIIAAPILMEANLPIGSTRFSSLWNKEAVKRHANNKLLERSFANGKYGKGIYHTDMTSLYPGERVSFAKRNFLSRI